MKQRVAGLILLAALGAAPATAPLSAQDPEVPIPLGDSTARDFQPWLLSYYPYVAGGVGRGPVLMARVRYFQPAPWQDRVTYRAETWVQAGIGLEGSRLAQIGVHAPLLADGWRVAGRLDARRNTRANYFGVGQFTERSDAREEADEFAYQVHRTTWRAQADLTRTLMGPLSVALGGSVSTDRWFALSPTSVFGEDAGDALKENDASGRLALVVDTRNNEFDPTNGLLVEFGGQMGSGGDGYERLYGIARGYHELRKGTVVAARLAASDMFGDPPLAARFELPGWEQPLKVYGGSTNRGLDGERRVGTGVLFGNLEVRQQLIWIQNTVGITLVGFADAGRVFEGERLRLTTDDLDVSGGGGLVFQLLRDAMFGVRVAGGPEGARFDISGGWAF